MNSDYAKEALRRAQNAQAAVNAIAPPPLDLDATLKRLAELTPQAERWFYQKLREDGEDADEEDESDTYALTVALRQHPHSGAWECGYSYQPDEATLWALMTEGRTPTEAVRALLAKIEEQTG